MHGSHVGREFVRMRRIKRTHSTIFYNNFIENIFLLNWLRLTLECFNITLKYLLTNWDTFVSFKIVSLLNKCTILLMLWPLALWLR